MVALPPPPIFLKQMRTASFKRTVLPDASTPSCSLSLPRPLCRRLLRAQLVSNGPSATWDASPRSGPPRIQPALRPTDVTAPFGVAYCCAAIRGRLCNGSLRPLRGLEVPLPHRAQHRESTRQNRLPSDAPPREHPRHNSQAPRGSPLPSLGTHLKAENDAKRWRTEQNVSWRTAPPPRPQGAHLRLALLAQVLPLPLPARLLSHLLALPPASGGLPAAGLALPQGCLLPVRARPVLALLARHLCTTSVDLVKETN